MSIHGVQIRLPFSLNNKSGEELSLEATIAANFIQFYKNLEEEEKIISLAHISWPFIFIQAEASKHIMIDDIGLCEFKSKLINSPRTAQVGHVLRNPELDIIEKLDFILEIIKFNKTIDLDGESTNTGGEYIDKTIKGLVEPKLLESFSKIIRKKSKFEMSELESLESLYTFDDALEYAEEYVHTLELLKGNEIQWRTVLELIEDPIEEKLLDLKVQKKDIIARYKSQIEKAKELDDSTIQNKVEVAKDFADQWTVRKHKEIIQNIGKLFVNTDLLNDEVKKRNSYFIDTESLKSEPVGQVVQKAFQHIAYLRHSIEESEKNLSIISKKMNEIKEELRKTNILADQKIDDVSADLLSKKEMQERQIQMLENEMNMKLNDLKDIKKKIKDSWQKIKDLIEQKIDECKFDLSKLKSWQLDDDEAAIETPTVRYFLPIGIAVIEDEDEDERIEIILPSYYDNNCKRIPLTHDLKKFEKKIIKTLDRNMKIRSNFEFACERGNLVGNGKLKEIISKGLNELKILKLIDEEDKNKWLQRAEQL